MSRYLIEYNYTRNECNSLTRAYESILVREVGTTRFVRTTYGRAKFYCGQVLPTVGSGLYLILIKTGAYKTMARK